MSDSATLDNTGQRSTTNPSSSQASPILGWALAVVYILNGALLIVLPRTEKTSVLREDLRGWHYLIGMVLLLLAGLRLWAWIKESKDAGRPAAMSAAAWRWHRQHCLAVLVLILFAAILGFLQGWGEGLTIRLGPFVDLPALLHENERIWMFGGYFHSAIGFATLLLTLSMLLSAGYSLFRYGAGTLTAFPAGFGPLAYGNLAIAVYAFSTFESPEPGPRAVSIFILITLAFWGVAAFLRRNRGRGSAPSADGVALRGAGAIAVLVLIGIGLYGPHLMFRVTPWPVGEVVAAPEGVTSHPEPLMTVSVTPPTAYEQQVAEETYKWCRFCHTVEPGDRHLVGPNLYAIFGQRAGTVPNFYYSESMAKAGREGLVWNDETLDAFLADPDAFMPGTSMIISSGPVSDPLERAAVINLLKRETMGSAIEEQSE